MRHILERGPVALWWYYRGKRGDLRVAFFLSSFMSMKRLRNRKDLGQIRAQLMRQKSSGQGFRKQPHLSYRDASAAPVKEPLRAYLTFMRKLGGVFSRLLGSYQYQFEDVVRRIHIVTQANNVSDRYKQYVCYHSNASPVTSRL